MTSFAFIVPSGLTDNLCPHCFSVPSAILPHTYQVIKPSGKSCLSHPLPMPIALLYTLMGTCTPVLLHLLVYGYLSSHQKITVEHILSF